MKLFTLIFVLVGQLNLSLLKEYENRSEADNVLERGETCNRNCTRNGKKSCYFHLEITSDYTMNNDCEGCPLNVTDCYNKFCIPADGVSRLVTVINGQLPGPLIKVCKDDEVVVDVKNSLSVDTATIHWHGMLQQGTQYNDGVPYVTQCPIQPGATFRYQFVADDSGTYFYHSHSGLQRVNGVTAPLIVSEPDDKNPMRKLYDHDLDEHVIVIFDWDHVTGLEKYEGLLRSPNGTNTPNSLLVNGYGRNQTYYDANGRSFLMPTARFHVTKGKRYRFRVINSGNLDCPILMSIDGHNMTVISSDGNDFEPVEVESLMSLAGERYDFILHADQDGGLFWMKFQGQLLCNANFNAVRQVAVLQYDNATNADDAYPPGHPTYEETHRDGLQLNPLTSPGPVQPSIAVSALKAKKPMESKLKGPPAFTYYTPFDLHDLFDLTAEIANISYKSLPFPLLSQRNEIEPGMLCNAQTFPEDYCSTNFCQCPHVVKMPLSKLTELVIINEASIISVDHPFHLHGYKFRVVAEGVLGRRTTLKAVKALYQSGNITRNLIDAPIKDTVSVPVGGFVVIRFVSSNPGFWLFHCHIEHHMEDGMKMVFQVGEMKDMPRVPKSFPTCGDYVPPRSPRS